jgi:predicted exporter
VLLLWLALLAAGLVVIATTLRLSTDLGQFLPRQTNNEQQLVLDELREGASARLLLLAIGGGDERQLAELSHALAEALEQSGEFLRVVNGPQSLPEAEWQRWFRYRYLLHDSSGEFAPVSLQRALNARLRELTSPLGTFAKQHLADDPLAAFRHWLQQWQGERAPREARGAWFTADGRALLFAETRAAGFDLDAQERTIARVRESFAALPGAESEALQLSGAGVLAVVSRDTIRSESQWLSLGAALAVALILLLVYRSPRLWLLSTLPPLSAVIVALALTSLAFGTVHGITLAFGITLLGVAIDYPIHLFSHLQRGVSPQYSMQRIWPTLRLGVISTAAGYLAMIATGLDGLMQLGVFTIIGLLAAAAATRWLLPHLLPEPWSAQGYAGEAPRRCRLPRTVRIAAVLLPLALAMAYLGLSEAPLWEDDVAALSPVPSELRQQDQQLRDSLPVGDLNHLLLISGDSAEAVLRQQERLAPALAALQGEGRIGSYRMAANWLPSRQLQQQRRQRLPSGDALRHAVAEAQQGLPFRDGAFDPFLAAVERSRQLEPLTPGMIEGTLLGVRIAPLLFQRAGRWWGMVRLGGVVEEGRWLEAWSVEQSLPGLRYLNLRATASAMINGFRDAALGHLAWGGLLIAMLLWWGLRSWRRALQALLPVAAAIAIAVAVLHLLGERLSLFHLTALLLVLGIGIDYSLFFSRIEGQGASAHALRVCAITTLSVFGILALSSLPVLHAIGLTVLLGVAASYGLAWLLAAQHDRPARNTIEN